MATIGVYIATKGKGNKAQNVIKKTAQGVTQKGQEATNIIKEMTVESFKQAGNKFKKGKALNPDGTGFSGTILNKTKNGAEVSLVYENGLIQKSTKTKNGEKIVEKTYSHDKNGSYWINIESKQTDGSLKKHFFRKDVDTENGVILRSRNGVRENDSYSSVSDLKTGKLLKENCTDFYYDNKGNLVTEHFKLGNITTSKNNNQIGNIVKFFDENGQTLYRR